MEKEAVQPTHPAGKELSKTDAALCSYLALFGVLIGLTCLFQLFVYSNFSLIPLVLMGLYVFNIISFVLLGFEKKQGPVFIFISVVISLLILLFYSFAYVISLIVVLLFVYNMVVAIVVITQDLQSKIKYKARLLKAEDEYWNGKI